MLLPFFYIIFPLNITHNSHIIDDIIEIQFRNSAYYSEIYRNIFVIYRNVMNKIISHLGNI